MEPGSLGQGNRMRFSKEDKRKDVSRWERMEPGSLGQGNRMRFSKRGQEKGCVSWGRERNQAHSDKEIG